MKISLAMIVKNEANHLETALKTVSGIDEIVICDTGSEDNTIEIARKYTDLVFDDYKWDDNFAEARNHVLAKVTGDWVLCLDADERLMTPVEELRKLAIEAEEQGFKTVSIRVKSESGIGEHRQPRLYKKHPDVFWKRRVHNHLSISEGLVSDAEIRYGYSDAHKRDPDRALRILKRVVEEEPDCTREKYYLAREYVYRHDYNTALEWYDKYLKVGKWLPERADAYLCAAWCLWNLRRADEARTYCMQAIVINPNFKEALRFMATMSWDEHAKRWNEFADLADNSNVLFKR